MLGILGMIILIIILFIILLLIIGIRISLEYVKNGSEFKGCIKILIFKKIKIYTLNFPAKDKTDELLDRLMAFLNPIMAEEPNIMMRCTTPMAAMAASP